MSTSAEKIRAYDGPALFSYGFRPFFLFGAVWSAIAVALWLPMLSGHLSLPTRLAPIEWHVHELLYGYVPAVIAGFLLTAVPNWTGRLPVVGLPLAMLFSAWLAGRAAVLLSAWIGTGGAAAIDLLFLAALGAVVAREIVASGNTRNLKVLVVVALLFVGNTLFHLEASGTLRGGYGTRLGVGATIFLITLIGGRIIPSFTRNWLVKRSAGRLPVPFDGFDKVAMAATALALAAWVAVPDQVVTAVLALAGGGLNMARLARWAGHRTTAEPLVLILHVAYSFVPVGFLLLAIGILTPGLVLPSGALHGWTAGAIGTMTLAVMTRASLGHTGQPLRATPGITAIYVAVTLAALGRIVAAFDIFRDAMLTVSAAAWVTAFLGFTIVYAPLLLNRRPA